MKEIVMRLTDSLRSRSARSAEMATYVATAGAAAFIIAMTLGMLPGNENAHQTGGVDRYLRADLSQPLYPQTPPIGAQ